MLAIEKLKIKIEELKHNFSQLQEENKLLKAEMESGLGEGAEELDRVRATLIAKESEITKLKKEITDKDTEIEAIIAKVETLLG